MSTDSHGEGRPNWVKERAECTLRFAFERLCKEIQDDLEQMKAYPSITHFPDDIRISQKDNVLLVQADMQGINSALLRVECKGAAILIRRPSAEGQVLESSVRTQWNAAQDRCDLLYEGTPLAYWEVCKRVLEPLFFDER